MKCAAFKPLARGSLLGFADLAMDSGLILLGCTFHESSSKKWCNPPGRVQIDADKKPVIGPDGKLAYAPVIMFSDDKTRYRWSAEAVKAIEAFLSKEPAEAGSMNGGNSQERSAAIGGRCES